MKRRIFKFVLFLLLGAIINITVAWGCAIVLPHSSREEVAIAKPTSSDEAADWHKMVQLRAIGCVVHEYQYDLRGATKVQANGPNIKYTLPRVCGNDTSEPIVRLFTAKIVPWSRLGLVTDAGRSLFIESELAAGWPEPALWGCIAGVDRGSGVMVHMSSIGIGASLKTDYGLSRPTHCLPLRVLWPGFAINTIFYAAILWLLFAAPFQFRRYRRIKRGLCPSCAYPIGSSEVCTECGAAIPSPLRGRAREGVGLQTQVQRTNNPEVYPPPRFRGLLQRRRKHEAPHTHDQSRAGWDIPKSEIAKNAKIFFPLFEGVARVF